MMAEIVDPNKIPNLDRVFIVSPASASNARLARNIDIVKPIPHKSATAKICLKLTPLGNLAKPNFTEI